MYRTRSYVQFSYSVFWVYFDLHAREQQRVFVFLTTAFLHRDAFCFTGLSINHLFHSSILSLIMYFFFCVFQNDISCEWRVNKWDHGCIIFFSTYTGTTSIPLPSAVILFKDCYLYPSSQVSQVKTASQSTRESHCYRRCTALHLLVHGNRDTIKHSPFPLSYGSLLLPLCYC